MKATFIGHASILVEAGGTSVLSDPWWRGPCFGAQWWNRPHPYLDPVEGHPPDYIYISHGHDDHLHPGTLKSIKKGSTVLVSSEIGIAQGIRDMGFDVAELAPFQPRSLSGGLTAWCWPTCSGDTLLVLEHGGEVCINLNDALHSAPRAIQDQNLSRLRSMFPNPDYVFCGYGIASHFPNCYRVPGKDDARTAATRQSYFNDQWAYIMHELAPKFGFPFAANVVFYERDLIDLNEPTHNSERPTERYKACYGVPDSFRLIDIAPGFQIESGQVTNERLFEPLNIKELATQDAEAVARANAYSPPTDEQIEKLEELLIENVDKCRPYLLEFTGSYRFRISFRGSDKAIDVSKEGPRISVTPVASSSPNDGPYDVVYRTRAVYLRRSLEEDYGNETLFVGSGGIFEFTTREAADRNLHRELMTIIRKHFRCPSSRYGDNPRWLFVVKQLLKQMLGRQPMDLYDLRRWIVYESQ